MPRKMRPTKARRTQAPDVSPALYLLLTWGDFPAAHAQAERDGTSPWELFCGDQHEAAWHAIEAQAVAEWADVHPGSRPPKWWHWSAPELRRLIGAAHVIKGLHRCHETGVPYISNGFDEDRPMVESTAALLDRLNLWLPGERARVPADAFAAKRFNYRDGDTMAPCRVPGRADFADEGDADDDTPAA